MEIVFKINMLKLQKAINRSGSTVLLTGFFLVLLSNFISIKSAKGIISPDFHTQSSDNNALNLKKPLQGIENHFHTRDKFFLIAASFELRSLYNTSYFDNRGRTVMRRGTIFPSYNTAFRNADSWFNYIIVKGSRRYLGYFVVAGNLWRGDLKGGGFANLREGGSSGRIPTLDTRDHYTSSPYQNVREVKFKYN